jgi:general secretion pathway protein M
MTGTADPRKRRRLALCLAALVAVLVVLAIALPVRAMHRHYDERIEGVDNQIAAYRRVLAYREQYQSRHAQLQAASGGDRRYLPGQNDSLASAELQRVAKQVITDRQGEILSTQVVRPVVEEGFSRVSVRIRMKCTLEQLVPIIHSLETGKPYLFISGVAIRSRNIARRRLPSTPEIEAAMAQLDVDFQLSGYMRSAGE